MRLGKPKQQANEPAEGAVAGSPAPAKRGRRGGEDAFQSRLWLIIGVLLLALAYVVGFVIANADAVKISFVFFSARTSLIWLILLSVAIGFVGGILLSQLVRRRGRRK